MTGTKLNLVYILQKKKINVENFWGRNCHLAPPPLCTALTCMQICDGANRWSERHAAEGRRPGVGGGGQCADILTQHSWNHFTILFFPVSTHSETVLFRKSTKHRHVLWSEGSRTRSVTEHSKRACILMHV